MTGRDRFDPKGIVEAGYDRIAERYAQWTGDALQGPRARYVSLLFERLPEGAAVLELGCGTGVPTTRELVTRFAVTGVDNSARSITVARLRVPGAMLEKADITRLAYAPASFDAIIAFYVFSHVPREEHAPFLHEIAAWLRPGGLFVASMSVGDDPGGVEEDWLGVPMYFSAFDSTTNKRMVGEAGLRLLGADEITENEDGVDVTFLWIVAEKAREPSLQGGRDRDRGGTGAGEKR
jgi:SAM-dependent methyltransferase